MLKSKNLLLSLSIEIPALEASKEGLLKGGFGSYSATTADTATGNANCNCNCSCTSNGNCNCNCGCTTTPTPTSKVKSPINPLGFNGSFLF